MYLYTIEQNDSENKEKWLHASIISCIDIKCSNMQYKQNELKQAKLFDCFIQVS